MNNYRLHIVYQNPERTVIVVENLKIDATHSHKIFWNTALMKPFAIVIKELTGIRAFNTMGEELLLENLMDEVKQLQPFLEDAEFNP